MAPTILPLRTFDFDHLDTAATQPPRHARTIAARALDPNWSRGSEPACPDEQGSIPEAVVGTECVPDRRPS
jgi:hypothetical protein